MRKILAYHYSNQKLSTLLTKAKQNNINHPADYERHISLFLSPIPTTIADLYNRYGYHHDFWSSGKPIYEHIVDITDLDITEYELVESPGDVKAMRDTDISVFEDEDKKVKYMREMKIRKIRDGEIGTNMNGFKKISKTYLGRNLAVDYIRMLRHVGDDETDVLGQYAPNVPHLMIYPTSGEIPVHSVSAKRFKIGRRVAHSTATLIRGNAKKTTIAGFGKEAAQMYKTIASYLEYRGFRVHIVSKATVAVGPLWIGHSRGGWECGKAPEGTITMTLGSCDFRDTKDDFCMPGDDAGTGKPHDGITAAHYRIPVAFFDRLDYHVVNNL